MTHRVIISSSFSTMFASPEVREQMTPAQCMEVDEVLACVEPTPAQITLLAFHAARVYRKPDGD